MPFGSERSHFAHSPHLLAALILLIPPEIWGELKRKARSRGCGLGFCARGPPGPRHAGPPSGRQWETCTARPRGMGGVHTFYWVRAVLEEGVRLSPPSPGSGVPRPGCSLHPAHQGAGCWGWLGMGEKSEAPAPRHPVHLKAGWGLGSRRVYKSSRLGSRTASHPYPGVVSRAD